MFPRSRLDERGREIPDPRRPVVPAGWRPPEPLAELVQRLVRSELSRQAVAEGQESFEEADDFEVDEDPDDFVSAYEVKEMVPEPGQDDATPLDTGKPVQKAADAPVAPQQSDPAQ